MNLILVAKLMTFHWTQLIDWWLQLVPLISKTNRSQTKTPGSLCLYFVMCSVARVLRLFPLYLLILVIAEKTPPEYPPLLDTLSGETTNNKALTSFIQKNIHLNKRIPKPNEHTLRFLQFQVNAFKSLSGSFNNVESVWSDIERIQPAVIIFVEVPKAGEQFRDLFDGMLSKGGFKYTFFFGREKSSVGNIIASRIELSGEINQKIGEENAFVMCASILINQQQSSIVVANVAASGDLRTAHMHLLRKFIHDNIVTKHINPNFLLFGNVDASTLALKEHDLELTDSFEMLNWPSPPYTDNKGQRSDFILCTEKLRNVILGAYMYFTVSTTHMPLLLDLYAHNASYHMEVIKFSKTSLYFFIFSVCVIFMVSAVGIYYWVRNKIHDDI